MAFKKTIDVDVNVTGIKSLEELGGTFEDVNGEAMPLSTTIGELEDRLYAMAVAGDTTSDEFKELSSQVGKMKKVIIETDLEIDGLSQTMSQNVTGALTGVASGFSLAQGAMGAFGVGGEEVEETLLKVQSAMAMSQGLQGLKESVSSFKALRKATMATAVVQSIYSAAIGTTTGAMKLFRLAMIATGIGAIVVGLIALAMNFKKVSNFVAGVTEKMGALGKVMKWTLAVVFWPFVVATKAVTAALEALGIIESEEAKASKRNHAKKMSQVNERLAKEKELKAELKKAHEAEQKNLDRLITLASAQGKSTVELTKKKINGSIEYQKNQLKEIENNIKILKSMSRTHKHMEKQFAEMIATQEKFLTDSTEAIADAETALVVIDIETKKKLSDNHKQFLADRLEATRRIEDLENDLEDDAQKKAIKKRTLEFERDLKDSKLKGKAKAEEAKLLEEQFQRDIINIKLSFIEPALAINAIEVDANKEKNNQILLDDKETAKQQAEIDKERTRSKVREAGNQYKASTEGLQMIADFAKTLAGNNERAQKKAFKIQQAASIAQATIGTYESAVAAFKSFAGIPVVGVPLGIAAAGAAVAAGIANIRSIASTQFEGGGSPSPSTPNAPSLGGGGNVANFNVVGNTGVNQLAESLGGQETVVKSYVVSGDVTTAQSLDRNKIDTATL
jgi:hypothetical protein